MDQSETLLTKIGFSKQSQANAYNLRKNGQTVQRFISDNTTIIGKPQNRGLEIHVRENVPFEVIDIPVIITESGLDETVENDIYIGEGSNVVILAGCGICIDGCVSSSHSGVHRFHVGDNAKLKYIERHYAIGEEADKIISPTSEIILGEKAEMKIETSQLGGVSHSDRVTKVKFADKSKLDINERIFTEKDQTATTKFVATITGRDAKLKITSRSVATQQSRQEFKSVIIGKSPCSAYVSCDGIIQDQASVQATPTIDAQHMRARLIHEASIGRIAREQLDKLMTLGLSKKQAEDVILEGFLK